MNKNKIKLLHFNVNINCIFKYILFDNLAYTLVHIFVSYIPCTDNSIYILPHDIIPSEN